MKWKLVFILLLSTVHAVAQYIPIDSLLKIIHSAKADTVRIDAMNWLSFRFFQKFEFDSSKQWAEKALNQSEKIKFKSGIGFAYINLANNSWDSLSNDNYFRKAIKVLEEADNKGYAGIAYSNLALLYQNSGNYEESLRHLYKSLKLQSESGLKFGVAHCYGILGIHYLVQGDYKEADENLQLATSIFRKLGEKHLYTMFIFKKGEANLAIGNYQFALDDFNLGREAYKEFGDPDWIKAYYYYSVGGVNEFKGDSCNRENKFQLADDYYKKSEKNYLAAVKIDSTEEIMWPFIKYSCLGRLYRKQKRKDLARTMFKKNIAFAKLQREKSLLSFSYLELSLLDSADGKFYDAYLNYKQHVLYRDSLFKEESARKMLRYKIEFEFDKKQDEIKLLTAENNVNAVLASKQKLQKKIAMAGMGLIAILGGYGFFRFRKRKRMQGQQALMEQRQNISRDLHDEVGATLSGISMYSHLVKSSVENNEVDAAKHAASIIQNSAADMVTKLNDIIWLINPDKDSLHDLIDKLKEYAQKLCPAKNIKADMQVFGDMDSFKPTIETRKNIYLFCREAINNGVKYSNAADLFMEFRLQPNFLKIIIRDNGVGFDMGKVKKGNGLDNMEKRAEEMGADFTIYSEPMKGCTISLAIKITQRGIA